MAAKLPVVAGAANYIDPIRALNTGVITSAQTLNANGTLVTERSTYITELYYFDATISNGDTWASGISGIKAAFWQADDVSQDECSVTLGDANGQIDFATSGTLVSGYLLLFIDPVVSGRSGQQGR